MKIYLDRPVHSGETIVVRDDFWDHYVTTVRRCREGDELEVVGREQVGSGRLEGTDPLTVSIAETRPANQPSYRLVVCQAISRKQKYDDLVRRGSDVGITDFIPLVTERTVRVPNKPEKQRDRWRRMALESARVSDRDWVSTIHPIVEYEEALDQLSGDTTLFVGDPAGQPPAGSFSNSPSKAALFIGPEGGFSEAEKLTLTDEAASVGLGSENYRAETASIMLSVLWLHETIGF